jgi:hypothetical protein
MNIQTAERKKRKRFAKGAKEKGIEGFFCVLCMLFAPFAFGILEVLQ